LLISALAILAFLLAPGLAAQHIEFEVEIQEPEQGQVINISNQSEELPEGAYFVFIFQDCAFAYDGAITCQLQTQDQQWSFEGFFWKAGSFTIQLIGISQEGDTFEMQAVKEINVMPLTNIPPSDSCYDTAAFSCTYNNLVCNGSFEWLFDSISSPSLLHFAMPWQDLLADCDIFSVHHTSSFLGNMAGVPSNFHGHQYPYYGDSYMGLAGSNNSNGFYFEVATAKLKKKLLKDQRYAIEYYTSKSDIWPYSCNGAQVFFSKTKLVQNPYSSWDDLRNLINSNWVSDALGNTIITDTVNWVKYYDVFIPDDDDLEWIGLGQIKDPQDILTSFDPSIPDPSSGNESYYYYYDNVSVRPLPPLVTMLQDTLEQVPCDSVELSVIGQGAGSYLWSTGATTSSIKVLVWNDSTFTVTVTDPEDCHDTILTAFVHYYEPEIVLPEIIGHNNDCDSLANYALSSGHGSNTYYWSISGNSGYFTENFSTALTKTGPVPVEIRWTNVPLRPSFATITVAIYNPCQEYLGSVTFKVYQCCELSGMHTTWNNVTLSDAIINGSNILINGTLTIDAQCLVHFDNTTGGGHLFMGPMAKIEVLSPNTELRIDNWTIVAGCEYMWDGIYLDDSSQWFRASSSIIKDALNAVVSDSGAMLQITGSVFEDNFNSILIRDFHLSDRPSIKANGMHWPAEIYGNEFLQFGYPTQPLPYHPKNTTFTQSAIELHNADSVIIGKLNQDTNLFHHMRQAILVHNSNAEIINNVFHDIAMLEETYPPAGAVAVYSLDSVKIPAAYTRIGNGGIDGLNAFTDCALAISSYQNPLTIHKNSFMNCLDGIHCLELKNQTFIKANVMEQSSLTSLSGNTGITLANVVSSPKALDLQVDSNQIQGYKKGIWGTNVDKPIPGNIQIRDNSIDFNVLAMRISGIKLDNCDGMLVKENLISCVTRPASGTSAANHHGIWVNQTGAALVTHNHLLRMGNGIYTTGPDMLTFFICNTLDSCFHGFFFGINTSLSHQGQYDVFNTANNWLGDYSDNNCIHWRRMMQDNYNIQNPVVNWYYPYNNSQYDPGFQHCGPVPSHELDGYVNPILNNGASADCQVVAPIPDLYETSTTTDRETYFGSIARGENSYGSLQSSYREAENTFFYHLATSRPELLSMNDTSDYGFQQYYSNLSSSNTGTRYQVSAFISDGDFAQAATLNSSLSDTSLWDKTAKKLNEIFLASWCQEQFGFYQEERDSLMSIAYASPYEKGDAVFSARVLLGIDPDNVPLPHSLPAPSIKDKSNALVFYPNPNFGILHFILTADNITDFSAGEICLMDLTGSVVFRKMLTLGAGEHSIGLPRLTPGLYLVKLTSESGLDETARIILK
jgi:hypothetical protein